MATAVLSARRDAGAGLVLVSLDVDDAVARAYVAPGQYVEVKAERGNGYFVLAGDVGAARWELLVRNAGDAAEALVTAPIGAAFEVSSPLGDGFPTARAARRPVVVAVVGSALAVARPVLRGRIGEGAARRTHLLLGLKSPRHLPLVSEVRAWLDAGVHVVLCLSRSERAHARGRAPLDEGTAGIAREHGYVQHVLGRVLSDPKGRASLRGALVVAAGPEAMLADMRALGDAHGVEVVTNV